MTFAAHRAMCCPFPKGLDVSPAIEASEWGRQATMVPKLGEPHLNSLNPRTAEIGDQDVDGATKLSGIGVHVRRSLLALQETQAPGTLTSLAPPSCRLSLGLSGSAAADDLACRPPSWAARSLRPK